MKIALYFAYLGHYTVALCFPTVLGIIFWFIQGENQVAQFIYSLKIDLSAMAHHRPLVDFVLVCGMHYSKCCHQKVASGKWLWIICLWRHQASFDSQTITILCIILSSDRMTIFSTLKIIL